MTRTLTAAAVLLLLALPALADGPCLTIRNIYTWHELDAHSMMMQDTGRHKFKVVYSGACGNLKSVMRIALKSTAASDLSCVQHGDWLLLRQNDVNYRCMVQSVEPYGEPQPHS